MLMELRQEVWQSLKDCGDDFDALSDFVDVFATPVYLRYCAT